MPAVPPHEERIIRDAESIVADAYNQYLAEVELEQHEEAQRKDRERWLVVGAWALASGVTSTIFAANSYEPGDETMRQFFIAGAVSSYTLMIGAGLKWLQKTNEHLKSRFNQLPQDPTE